MYQWDTHTWWLTTGSSSSSTHISSSSTHSTHSSSSSSSSGRSRPELTCATLTTAAVDVGGATAVPTMLLMEPEVTVAVSAMATVEAKVRVKARVKARVKVKVKVKVGLEGRATTTHSRPPPRLISTRLRMYRGKTWWGE
jgi:hypothetical protein